MTTAMKTSELIDLGLDWAVAKYENPEWWENGYMDGDPLAALDMDDGDVYAPSTEWSQGGPIIEREEISIEFDKAGFRDLWVAYKLGLPFEDNPECGPTPLVAAMRCFVASRLGDEIEIPEELK